jgi:ornithine--oxo-acid transaminase
MMIALEFGKPDSFRLKAAWKLLETANDSLFGQLITVPLFTKHRILSQIAGHHMHIVKFLPPLIIGQEDRHWIASACETTIAEAHQVGGAVWDLGKQLAGAAIRMKTGS